MKIIFLDIDGVLNNHTTLIPWGFDNECIKYFNWILQKTDAKIIISSAWRYLIIDGQMTLKGFETMMRTHGINCLNRVIGLTTLDDIIFEREDQIKLWISVKKESIEKFIIIDDCWEFPTYKNNFVHTDGYYGLTFKDAEKAIQILGEKNV